MRSKFYSEDMDNTEVRLSTVEKDFGFFPIIHIIFNIDLLFVSSFYKMYDIDRKIWTGTCP